LGSLSLFALINTAAHGQRATLTSHVPDEVTTRVAPLVGHVSSQHRLNLALSLPLRNEPELLKLIDDIYDPHSPDYHKYVSASEFAERFAATEADFNQVVRFAESNGLRVVKKPSNRMVVSVEGPAANVESAFHVSLGVFQHPTEARTFFAPDREPTMDLDVPVLHVDGLDDFSPPRPKYVENAVSTAVAPPAKGSGPSGSFLGSDLRMAYYGTGTLNGSGQTLAIFALGPYNPTSISTYFANAHQSQNVPIKAISVDGTAATCGSGCNDAEQALDIEQAISMAPGLTQLRLYVGKSNISIFNQIAADNVAKSVSCSWGWAKNASSLDPILEEMASQGQSVFVATGDQGSATAANVVWPSDDPWVTAVGGTVLTTKSAGGAWQSETGWANSAGMITKNSVTIPTYQQLVGVITSSNHGSKTLRNIPDVASESNGSQYICSNGSCRTHGGGTSYAAPLWAGLIALANQQAASAGKPTVGLINTALYNIGVGSGFSSDFHDESSGSNGGYTSVKNYDLVTGWGSPSGVNLINALAPKN
jgi:subtilase family serine protease